MTAAAACGGSEARVRCPSVQPTTTRKLRGRSVPWRSSGEAPWRLDRVRQLPGEGRKHDHHHGTAARTEARVSARTARLTPEQGRHCACDRLASVLTVAF